MQSLLPSWLDRYNVWARQVNSDLSRMGDGRQVVYVPLFGRMLHRGILDSGFSYDGVHLNVHGYKLWGREIESLVARHAPPPAPALDLSAGIAR
jgi:lysophospholipase L1-like esterase